MDSKEVHIKPEETADAAEKRTEAEAQAEKEVEKLRQLYKSLEQSVLGDEEVKDLETLKTAGEKMERFHSAAADNPEALKTLEEEIGVDYGILFGDVQRTRAKITGVKIMMGLDVSEEELSELREQSRDLVDDMLKDLKEDLSQATPEERAKYVEEMRRLVAFDPLRRELIEKVFQELGVVGMDVASDLDSEKA